MMSSRSRRAVVRPLAALSPLLSLLVAIVFAARVDAQARSAPTASQGRLSAGWAALEAGRADEAARVAAQVLSEAPDNHAGTLLLIAALSRGPNPVAALDRYETWSARSGAADPHLASVIGEGVLLTLADSESEPTLRLAAAEALGEFRVLGAQAVLARVAKVSGWAGLAALAKAGDENAAGTLSDQADQLPGSARVEALSRLATGRFRGAFEALVRAAGSPDEMVRAAAADGLRTLGNPEAVATLGGMLTDPAGVARQAAALALASLGDSRGEPLVSAMVNSGVPDIVLSVAEALPDNQPLWLDQVTPLLQAEDATDRLRAATLLFAARRTEAEAEILAGLSSENPAIREEAARAANRVRLSPGPTTIREMLADASPWVRLAAGKLLLAAVSAPS